MGGCQDVRIVCETFAQAEQKMERLVLNGTDGLDSPHGAGSIDEGGVL